MTGDVWMNKRKVELNQIPSMVEAARGESPESSVVIIADKEAPTGALIDVMDKVRLGGVSNISVAAQEAG